MATIDNEDPSLEEVVKQAIESRLLELHVSIPAEIIKYDGVKADIQPLLKRKFTDGSVKALPPISNVPVIWPGDNDSVITFPIKKGSTGTLIFSERSIDTWLVSGGCISPDNPRKHDLSDAQFIPGLRPFDVQSFFDPTKIVIKNKSGIMKISPDGKLSFSNGVEELLDVLDQFVDNSIEVLKQLGEVDTTNTIFGPQKPNNFASYQTQKADLQAIKSKLAQLKE
ncbi:MAG: Gp138 family membrane-puncturing spike protein [Thermodesulfobacteriota bacterium]